MGGHESEKMIRRADKSRGQHMATKLVVSSTARVHQFRQRKKRHAMMLMIEVPAGLVDALVDDDRLKEWDTENVSAIRDAIEEVFAQIVRNSVSGG